MTRIISDFLQLVSPVAAMAVRILYDLWVSYMKRELIPASTVSTLCQLWLVQCKITLDLYSMLALCMNTHAHTASSPHLVYIIARPPPPSNRDLSWDTQAGMRTHKHTHTCTNTHVSVALIFNTSSCTSLSKWNTEAQCCTSASCRQTDFTLILSA